MVEIMFDEVVFLAPAGKKPVTEDLFIVRGDVFNGKTAPVHVHRLGWSAFEVGAAEGKEILTVLTAAGKVSWTGL